MEARRKTRFILFCVRTMSDKMFEKKE